MTQKRFSGGIDRIYKINKKPQRFQRKKPVFSVNSVARNLYQSVDKKTGD